MKRYAQVKNRLSILLAVAILMVVGIFVLVSCGVGPQLKVTDPETGQFALDFSLTNNGLRGAVLTENTNIVTGIHAAKTYSLTDKELTLEAWVKSKSTSTSGGIIGRMDSRGAALFIKGSVPKFGVRYKSVTSSVTSTPPGCTRLSASSTECIVPGTATLVQNVWTHIAGVLVNEVHSHAVTSNCTTAVMAQTPHLDIYIDGSFNNCSTTLSKFAENTSVSQVVTVGTIGESGTPPMDTTVLISTPLDAVIDEARFWTTARTVSEINACMNRELSNDTSTCGGDSADLLNYFRFNEGSGNGVVDWAGFGAGELSSNMSSGWVAGPNITLYPLLD
ncbi:MAG: hypothetical protein ISR96_09640 [Nitrospira sp.]|nr:hypothetical protein [bacterium]MBL7049762.1 hypothetical protein [Nitrospira sp.]